MSPIRLLAALMLAAAFVAPHVVAQGRTSLASEQLQQEKKREQPPAAEGEVKFSYSETTEIVGAEKGASGLAAKPGPK